MAIAVQSGTSTVFTIDPNTQITLLNVNKNTLVADDFKFT
jgi:hypothetical protein